MNNCRYFYPYALLFLFALFLSLSVFAPCGYCRADEAVFERGEVYVGGEDGYRAYRLPTTVITSDGSLLVFCDGRMFSASDLGKIINPVVRRSTDGGRTWGPMKVLDCTPGKKKGRIDKSKIGNGSPTYDRQTDTVHFLYLKDLAQAFIISSSDGGKTFSEPREITPVFDEFKFPWKYFCTGHAHGIQTGDGRLIVPVWLSNCPRTAERNAIFTAGMIHSDDHGKTFKAGVLLDAEKFTRLNEGTVFECPDGSLCYNVREMGKGARVVARSNDKGKTWSEPKLNRQLPDPTCQASSLVLPSKDGRHRVLFCNPIGPQRKNLTIRLSYDDGRSWPITKTVDSSGFAAYCDMAVGEDGMVYVVYERGKKSPYEKVALARFNIEWLTDGKDSITQEK